jgi:hypothetical protein
LDPSEQPAPSAQEVQLLKLLLGGDEHVATVSAHLCLDWIAHPTVRVIVEQRLRLQAEGRWQSVAAFLGEFGEESPARTLVGRCLTEERPIPNPARQMTDILVGLRNQAISRQAAELLRQLGNPELDDNRRIELLRRQQELLQAKRRPLENPAAT